MNVKKLDKALCEVNQMRGKERRYALEGYVRDMDRFYFKTEERKIKEVNKKFTVLIVISTVISIVVSTVIGCFLNSKSR